MREGSYDKRFYRCTEKGKGVNSEEHYSGRVTPERTDRMNFNMCVGTYTCVRVYVCVHVRNKEEGVRKGVSGTKDYHMVYKI